MLHGSSKPAVLSAIGQRRLDKRVVANYYFGDKTLFPTTWARTSTDVYAFARCRALLA